MVVLSDLLGFASIACWLGAQFPQVIENMRRQSCEGLALPFLANWLLGDISNLVGCILTNQLPFQKWLATYFVIVDCTLVAQYFYYDRTPTTKPISHFGHTPRSATLPGARRVSLDRGHSRYRTLSAVAANVAAAAALAAQKQEEQQPPGSARSLRPYPTYGADDVHAGLSSATALTEEDREEEGDAMGASFYSEGGRSASGRKRLAWSVEGPPRRSGSVGRYPPVHRPTTPSAYLNASPEIQARDPNLPLPSPDVDEEDSDAGASHARKGSRASRRGATMVFLSTWALFGIGTLANRGPIYSSPSSSVGRLLFPQQGSVVSVPHVSQALDNSPTNLAGGLVPKAALEVEEGDLWVNIHHSLLRAEEEHPPIPHPQEPDSQRVLGRFFAWLCTMLYLTSRLPQIWKNFVRKSVEGLSMYLFIFAFLGNVFYVASILLSPKTLLPPPQASEFIRESIPYLLGSGGTLCFDIAIVTQSLIYRPRPKRQHTTPRTLEEEAGLLTSDDIESHPPLSSGEAAIMNRGRVARTRSLGPP